MLLAASYSLPPLAFGGTTGTFADGASSVEHQFPMGGGDFTVYVKVPAASLTLSTALALRGDKIPNERSFVHTSPSDFGTGMEENVSFGLDNLTRDTTAVQFAPMTGYATGRVPHYIATGDLNGDDLMDVAVTNRLSNNTGVFFQNPGGTLDAMVSLPVGATPNGIAVGDINGDGQNDLVVAAVRSDMSGYISIFNQTTAGAFPVRDDINAGTYPDGIALGLLNNDTRLDIAVANYGDGTIGVYLQNAAGGFYPMIPYAVGNGPRCVEIGDVNNDGREDLVNTVFFDNKTVIHYQTFSGQLLMPATKMDSGFSPVGLAIGDVDSNGRPDIVVANSQSNNTGVYYQKPDGTLLGMVTVLPGGSQTWRPAIGDLNDDRRLDIAVSNYWPNANSIDIAAEDLFWTLKTMRTLTGPGGPDGVAIADLDGDGLGDVVSANSRTDTIGVFRQRPYAGVFTSAPVTAPINIARVCATWVQTLSGAPVNVEFSNNGGLDWTEATAGRELTFPTTGETLRYRINFTSATGLEEIRVFYTLETIYPTDVSIDVGGDDTVDWSRPGVLSGTEPLPEISPNITAYVAAHPELADPEGNISVPLRFSSTTAGILNLSGLGIEFNIPPKISGFSPQGRPIVVAEGASQNFTVNASDPEKMALTYSWSIDGGLQPGMDRVFEYRPGYDQAGFHNLTVNVSDGKSVVYVRWELSVRNVNRPPQITDAQPAGDPGSREGQGVMFAATVRDPDFDAVTVDWYLDGVRVKTETGGSVSYPYRPGYGENGPHEVTMIATDPEEARTSHTWRFVVSWVNPVTEFNLTQPAGDVQLDEGGSQVFSVDTLGTLKVLGVFTLKWRLDGNSTTTAANYTYSPGYFESGNHTVSVTVTAGSLVFQRSWKVSVREVTNAPVITLAEPALGEVSMKEGDRLVFGVSAADPENDALSYRWLLTYDGIFDLQVGTLANYTFEANYTSEGRYVVRVVVSDGRTQTEHRWDLWVVHAAKPVPPAPGPNMILTAMAVLVVIVVLGGVLALAWKKRESWSAALDKVGGAPAAAPSPAAPAASAPKYEEPPKPKPKAAYPCPSCGKPAEEDWFVCHHCSAPLKGASDMPSGTARPSTYETRATEEALARSKLSIEALECPKCGKILEPTIENCPTCGEFVRKLEPEGAVTAPAGNCPSCGAPTEAEWLKCPECGAQLKELPRQPAGQAEEAAPAAPAGPAPAAADGGTKGEEAAPPPKAGGCPACGNTVEAGWKTCPECGTGLNG